MATLYPERFFIGIDRVSSVIAKGAADAVEQNVTNLMYVIGDIADIATNIPNRGVERIFLNFSDPWPRRRTHERRLTHASKLRVYERLLGPDGVLEQKTDNADLFEWSVLSFQRAGWTLRSIERNFSAGMPDPAYLSSKYVPTEYETKFRKDGLPIYYLQATPPTHDRQ